MENPITEKEKGKNKIDRDSQTYYRVAFKNNANLLQIADNKANIIITINCLVLSSTIAVLGYGSFSDMIEITSALQIGAILLFFGILLTSILFAVQAAKPVIVGKNPKGEKPRSSLLFFGESSKYSMEDYLRETQKVLAEKSAIHDHMSISLYYQGTVLNRKYKLIRRAYEIFVLGLAVGIIIFIAYLTY